MGSGWQWREHGWEGSGSCSRVVDRWLSRIEEGRESGRLRIEERRRRRPCGRRRADRSASARTRWFGGGGLLRRTSATRGARARRAAAPAAAGSARRGPCVRRPRRGAGLSRGEAASGRRLWGVGERPGQPPSEKSQTITPMVAKRCNDWGAAPNVNSTSCRPHSEKAEKWLPIRAGRQG